MSAALASPEAVKQEIDASHQKGGPAKQGSDALNNRITETSHVNDSREVSPARLTLIMIGLGLSVYIVSLDSTIVAPAIPRISNDFQSIADITWWISIYFATSTAFQPAFGPLYRINTKWTYLGSILIFEGGSLICAVAPNSKVFIGGRAVAGLGLGGGYVGTLTIIGIAAPLHLRALMSNIIGSVYGLGAVSGPLIGGAFVSKVTWRWCFYINLPLGGITLLLIFLFLEVPPRPKDKHSKTARQHLMEVDSVGSLLLLASLICLFLALQEGGITKPWNSSEVIGLIVGSIAIGATVPLWCWFRGENSIMPPRLMKNRTMYGGAIINFGVGGAYFSVITFLAYYYQSRGSSALRSGVQLLPLIAGVIFASMVEGAIAPKVGYVPPFLYVGMVCFIAGVGALIALDENTKTATWAGITFLCGVGSGLVWQMPFIAIQTVLKGADTEVGSAMIVFYQTLGGAVIFSFNQAIYQNFFTKGVESIAGLPNPALVAQSGVTAFRQLAPPQFVEQITVIAVDSIRKIYYGSLAALVVSLLAVPLIQWNSIAQQKPANDKASEQTAVEA